MISRKPSKIRKTRDVLTPDNRTVIEGFSPVEVREEAFLLAGDLVAHYAGLSLGSIRSIVEEALTIIERRVVVSPSTVILPELDEGSPASSGE